MGPLLDTTGAAGTGGSLRVTEPPGRELQPFTVIIKLLYVPAVRPVSTTLPVAPDSMEAVGWGTVFFEYVTLYVVLAVPPLIVTVPLLPLHVVGFVEVSPVITGVGFTTTVA